MPEDHASFAPADDGDAGRRAPGDTPLAIVEGNLRADGFSGQFRALRHGDLQCLTCQAVFPASTQHADQVTRLEGASDPDDMVIVIPVVCPVCATHGTLIANYGPTATEEDSAVLLALQRIPAEGSGRDPSPGIR